MALFQVSGNFKVGCDHVSWIGPNLLHLLPRISFGIPLEAGPISRGEGKQVARVCATLSHRYLVVDGQASVPLSLASFNQIQCYQCYSEGSKHR